MWKPRTVTDLQMGDEGVADAYVVLPLGAFPREVLNLTDPQAPQKPSEIVYLTGQADLLARFCVSDFRDVVKNQYTVGQPAAQVFNWIFSVRLRSAGVERAPEQTLRYFLHLRLHHPLYADSTTRIEVDVMNYLDAKLRERNCSAQIHAGLGWADVIVDGRFDPQNMSQFMQFLLDVHEAHVKHAGGEQPVFSRMLTILGYEWGESHGGRLAPELPNVTPAMFIRARPGRYQEALHYIRELVNVPVVARLVVGRSDVMLLCESPAPNLLANHLQLAARETELSTHHDAAAVERLETHLIFEPPPSREGTNTLVGDYAVKLEAHCHCRECLRDWKTPGNPIPEELEQPIRHVEFLFYNVLRDPASCCDVAPAVRAVHASLGRLYSSLLFQHRQLKIHNVLFEENPTWENADRIEYDHGRIEEQHKMFERWYLISERMLRQRTTGSFDELLLQTDRAVVYRGSVQKFLYLADCLMDDFIAKINGEPLGPIFATLYDAASHIMSLRQTGLIRIPVRHLFTLPDVIPNLWHEVGVFWFYLLDLRPEVFGLAVSPADAALYSELGDYYADLVVLRHGFLRQEKRFVISLTRAWIDSLAYEDVPPYILDTKFAEHLARVEFARYNHYYVESLLLSPLTAHPRTFEWGKAKSRMRMLHAYLRASFPRREPKQGQDPSRIPPLNERLLSNAVGLLKAKLDRFGESLPRNYSETVSAVSFDPNIADAKRNWLRSYEGNIVEFGEQDDLNVLFGELYWMIRQHRLEMNERLPTAFRKMAGLAKSATIEYHRRQVNQASFFASSS